MKKLLFVLFACAVVTYAQKNAETYLKSIPAIPVNTCNLTNNEKDEFASKVNSLLNEIRDEKVKRTKEFEKSIDKNKLAKKNMPEGVMNMSDEEIAKLKNMTEAEKKAFAQKMMQKVMKDPSAYTSKITKEQYEKEKSEQDFQLNLLKTMTEYNDKFQQKINKLDEEARFFNDKNIKPLETKFNEQSGGEGATEAEIAEGNRLMAEIKTFKEQYCSFFTPKYIALVDEYLVFVKSNLSDVRKSEEIAAAKVDKKSPDTMSLDLVHDYFGHLKYVFKYDILNH